MVPEGPLPIARTSVAGSPRTDTRAVGTPETYLEPIGPFQPALRESFGHLPGVKTPGYYPASLVDGHKFGSNRKVWAWG
jgi:hypothetical protein